MSNQVKQANDYVDVLPPPGITKTKITGPGSKLAQRVYTYMTNGPFSQVEAFKKLEAEIKQHDKIKYFDLLNRAVEDYFRLLPDGLVSIDGKKTNIDNYIKRNNFRNGQLTNWLYTATNAFQKITLKYHDLLVFKESMKLRNLAVKDDLISLYERIPVIENKDKEKTKSQDEKDLANQVQAIDIQESVMKRVDETKVAYNDQELNALIKDWVKILPLYEAVITEFYKTGMGANGIMPSKVNNLLLNVSYRSKNETQRGVIELMVFVCMLSRYPRTAFDAYKTRYDIEAGVTNELELLNDRLRNGASEVQYTKPKNVLMLYHDKLKKNGIIIFNLENLMEETNSLIDDQMSTLCDSFSQYNNSDSYKVLNPLNEQDYFDIFKDETSDCLFLLVLTMESYTTPRGRDDLIKVFVEYMLNFCIYNVEFLKKVLKDFNTRYISKEEMGCLVLLESSMKIIDENKKLFRDIDRNEALKKQIAAVRKVVQDAAERNRTFSSSTDEFAKKSEENKKLIDDDALKDKLQSASDGLKKQKAIDEDAKIKQKSIDDAGKLAGDRMKQKILDEKEEIAKVGAFKISLESELQKLETNRKDLLNLKNNFMAPEQLRTIKMSDKQAAALLLKKSAKCNTALDNWMSFYNSSGLYYNAEKNTSTLKDIWKDIKLDDTFIAEVEQCIANCYKSTDGIRGLQHEVNAMHLNLHFSKGVVDSFALVNIQWQKFLSVS